MKSFVARQIAIENISKRVKQVNLTMAAPEILQALRCFIDYDTDLLCSVADATGNSLDAKEVLKDIHLMQAAGRLVIHKAGL